MSISLFYVTFIIMKGKRKRKEGRERWGAESRPFARVCIRLLR